MYDVVVCFIVDKIPFYRFCIKGIYLFLKFYKFITRVYLNFRTIDFQQQVFQ